LKARQSRPAALGEQNYRQLTPCGDLKQAILLCVVAYALGAGENHVVVGHRHALPAVDLADPTDQAIGGSAGDQLIPRTPALLGGEEQRPVLDEGALVQEIREVLAGGAPPTLVALGDRLGPRRVQSDLMALTHRQEVRALATAHFGIRLGGWHHREIIAHSM
jgi:hypothetical protein